MVASSWDEAIRAVLADEGGYSNHPSDPGGPTNWGITLADARHFWKADATADDVRAMPLKVATEIYRAHYWDAIAGDRLPAGVDYALFDYGVNSGIARAGKVLRRLLSLDPRTYAITDEVIAAVAKRDALALVRALCAERRAFLKSLKTWPVFGRGWSRRVDHVEKVALSLARSEALTVPSAPTSAEASPAPVAIKSVIAALLTATAGAAAAIRNLDPLVGLAVLIAFCAGAGVIYALWSRRRKSALPKVPNQEKINELD